MDKRQQIRQQIRTQRRSLDETERQQAAIQLCNQLDHSRLFNNSQHIAFYLANDGEIDPYYLMHAAWQRGKQAYLPVLGIRPGNRLWFIPYDADTPLVYNRFGIPEPVHSRRQRQLKPHTLDLIFMPLVAFDPHGNRLGMGGGFYDRTLSFLKQRHSWRKPRLVGLAYEFQQNKAIPHQQWDVPLDGIATEQHIYLV
jgi:5-formyltetrahydrofolate cyclo-ligase